MASATAGLIALPDCLDRLNQIPELAFATIDDAAVGPCVRPMN